MLQIQLLKLNNILVQYTKEAADFANELNNLASQLPCNQDCWAQVSIKFSAYLPPEENLP